MNEKNSTNGTNWEDLRKALFSTEEISTGKLAVLISGAIFEANIKGLTIEDLEKISGFNQSDIRKILNFNSQVTVSSVVNLLVSLGRTVEIITISNNEKLEC